MVVDSMLALIGKTPMVKLKKISKDIPAEIWAKLEFFNPSGSLKDRIALGMIEEAEKRGQIKKGAVIIEPTSGNTGIGLAFVCALKGYQMIAVMPEAMSTERRYLVELFGAKVEIVPSCCGDPTGGFSKDDLEATIEKAKKLNAEIPNSFMPNQFDNADNPKTHAETTALEILADTEGKFDAYVMSCGTGGTFSGVAEVLKKKCPHIKRVVVEPAGSAVISGGEPGFHKIQGIGEGFIPCNMNTALVDEVVQVSDDEAMKMARRLAREEGILTGISGGANVFASIKVSKNLNKGNIVVTLIPDNVLRYFSTDLFKS